jgi:hypothetical protein
LYFLPLLLSNKNRVHTDSVAEGKLLPSLKEFAQISITFFITLIAWVFFRAESMTSAFGYLKGIFSKSLFTLPQIQPVDTLVLLVGFVLVEWLQREKQHGLQFDGLKVPRFVRWGLYYTVIIIIVMFGGEQQEFIYFQF